MAGVLGNGVDHLDPPGLLEPGEAALAEGAHVVEAGHRLAGFGHDHRADHLSPLLVGQPDHGDVGDAGTLPEDRLDLRAARTVSPPVRITSRARPTIER